jgi:hypothetical protein
VNTKVNAQTGKLNIHFITPTIDTQNTLPLLHVSAADRHLQDAKPTAQALLLFFNYTLQPSRLIVRSWLDVPTFANRRLHATAPSGGRWNCGREMSGNFA